MIAWIEWRRYAPPPAPKRCDTGARSWPCPKRKSVCGSFLKAPFGSRAGLPGRPKSWPAFRKPTGRRSASVWPGWAKKSGATRKETKIARQDPDHGHRKPVIEKHASQHTGIGVEPASPETVRQNGNAVRLMRQFLIREAFPHRERHAEGLEKVRRNSRDQHPVH